MYIFYKVYYRITCIQSNNDTGNISSIVPMSFENRLRIDPKQINRIKLQQNHITIFK